MCGTYFLYVKLFFHKHGGGDPLSMCLWSGLYPEYIY